MAAKKDSKTNKTAHVLSLLTDPEEVSSENSVEENLEGAPSAPQMQPVTPPVLEVARANDGAISEKIREGLEKELALALEGDLEENIEVHEPESAPARQPETVPTNMPQAEIPDEHVPEEALPQKIEKENASAVPSAIPPEHLEPAIPVPPKPVAADVHGVACVNVMQTLVEEKADKYIRMFGLCKCPRCRIDVIALSLTNLPAKYVVIKEAEAIPMLSVYEGRYSTAVISQVMWACKRVLDFPRHDKPE